VRKSKPGKGKGPVLTKSLNLATGKESNAVTAFTEANWGKATRGYLKSINALDLDRFNEIVEIAKGYSITNQSGRSSLTSLDQIEEVDERALLLEGGYDSASESGDARCKCCLFNSAIRVC
jgi:hypothetical protein